MASNYFEVFNASGSLVSTAYFTTPDGAQQHLSALLSRGDEDGPLHVGQACSEHDEHEHGNCRYCDQVRNTNECVCQDQPGYSDFGCVCYRSPFQKTEAQLKEALHLIKLHIGPEEIAQNRDLHNAVQLLVSVA